MARDTMAFEWEETDGRVEYLNHDFMMLASSQMKWAGVKVAKAFPDWKVRVTGGPYRMYDVAYRIDMDERCLHIDFYSVNPGFRDLDELIAEVKDKLEGTCPTPTAN